MPEFTVRVLALSGLADSRATHAKVMLGLSKFDGLERLPVFTSLIPARNIRGSGAGLLCVIVCRAEQADSLDLFVQQVVAPCSADGPADVTYVDLDGDLRRGAAHTGILATFAEFIHWRPGEAPDKTTLSDALKRLDQSRRYHSLLPLFPGQVLELVIEIGEGSAREVLLLQLWMNADYWMAVRQEMESILAPPRSSECCGVVQAVIPHSGNRSYRITENISV
jgi:hypothetical protein